MSQQFIDQDSIGFRTEQDCEEYLIKLRWSSGFCCPWCDHNEAFNIRTRKLLECKECRMQVSLTAGTIMHKSKLPLQMWFQAIHLFIQERGDCTVSTLARSLGINYRSAQLLMKKIQFGYEYSHHRLSLLNKRSNSSNSSMNEENQDSASNKVTLETPEHDPKDLPSWNLQSYLASKLTRLSTKLTIENIDLKNSIAISRKYIKSNVSTKMDSCSLIQQWFKMAVSNYFYPTFLKCFQI